MSRKTESSRTELLQRWQQYKPQPASPIYTEWCRRKIIIEDESHHPTGTYKARHGWKMGEHYLQNHFPNPFIYYLGSTGNAGMADFHYADLLNATLGESKIKVVCFYPEHYDRKLLGPDSFGRFTDGKKVREQMEKYASGKVISVDFKERYWFDDCNLGSTPCLDKMVELGVSVTRDNSLDITEGFKPTYTSLMEEYISQINSRFTTIPKTLMIIQFGAGILYNDCMAVAMNKWPQDYKRCSLDTFVSESVYGCFCRVPANSPWPIGFLAVSSGNKKTIADKIHDSSETWQFSTKDLLNIGRTFIKKSDLGYRDLIYHVEEQEILSAMSKFKELGIEAEPSGAAGMSIIPRLSEIVRREYDLVAVINTGNGIKECAGMVKR